VHLWPPAAAVFGRLASELAVPLRERAPQIRYSGDFYGQDGAGVRYHESISVEGLQQIVTDLPLGITELGCHPGFGDDFNSGYAREREIEVATLCDPRVRETLEWCQVELSSFADLSRDASR
jgi:predicted glycoside hydrolase/deacetylase ChbG (UPF0249 family)